MKNMKNENCDVEDIYCVTYRIDARHVVAVHAKNMEEARRSADEKFMDADFGELTDFVETEAVMIEDPSGNYVWEK